MQHRERCESIMANIVIIKDPYLNYDALENVVNYVINENATHGVYGGYGVLLDNPYYYMDKVRTYYRNTGKQVQHFVLSFDKWDNQICTYDIYEIGYRICALFSSYQSVFGFHQNTDNPHIHFAINPVRIHDGKKLNFTYEETFTFRKRIAEILEPYSIRCNMAMD